MHWWSFEVDPGCSTEIFHKNKLFCTNMNQTYTLFFKTFEANAQLIWENTASSDFSKYRKYQEIFRKWWLDMWGFDNSQCLHDRNVWQIFYVDIDLYLAFNCKYDQFWINAICVCVIHILSIMVKNILHLNVSRIKCVWNEHFGLIGDICDAWTHLRGASL